MHNSINRCQAYELLEFPIFHLIVSQKNTYVLSWSAMLVLPKVLFTHRYTWHNFCLNTFAFYKRQMY